MDSTEKSFTRRMLHRASMKKQRDENLNLSADDLRRRLSVLQAIRPKNIAFNGPMDKETTDCQNGNDCGRVDDKQQCAYDTLKRNQFTKSDTYITARKNVTNYYLSTELNKPFLKISESMTQQNPLGFNAVLQNDGPSSPDNIDALHETKDCLVSEHNNSLTTFYKNEQTDEAIKNLHTASEVCTDRTTSLNFVRPNIIPDSSSSDDYEDPNYLAWMFYRNKYIQNLPEIYNCGPKSLNYLQVNSLNFLCSNDNNSEILPNDDYKSMNYLNDLERLNHPTNNIHSDLVRSDNNELSSIQHELQNDVKYSDGTDNMVDQTFSTPTACDITNNNRDVQQASEMNLLPSSSDSKEFKLDTVKWSAFYDDACASSKREKSDYGNIVNFNDTCKYSLKSQTATEPEVLKVECKIIKIPSEMRADLVIIDTVPETTVDINNVPDEHRPQNCSSLMSLQNKNLNYDEDKLSLPVDNLNFQGDVQHSSKINPCPSQNNTQEDTSSTTYLSATIRALNAEIEQLDFRPNVLTAQNITDLTHSDAVSPNLTKDKCVPAIYSPKVQYQFSSHFESNKNESSVIINETSESSRHFSSQVFNIEDKFTTSMFKGNETDVVAEILEKNKLINTDDDIYLESKSNSTNNLDNTSEKNVTYYSIHTNYDENVSQPIEKASEQVIQKKHESIYSELNQDNVNSTSFAQDTFANSMIKPIDSSPLPSSETVLQSKSSSCFRKNSTAELFNFEPLEYENVILKRITPPSQIEDSVSTTTMPESFKIAENMQTSQHLYANQENLDNSIPYVVKNFLENALGNENLDSTITDVSSDIRDRTTGSEDNTPPRKEIKHAFKLPITEPPPQYSNPFDRTLTMYRSLTQKIKKKLRPGLKSPTSTLSSTSESTSIDPFTYITIPANVNVDEKIQKLLQEIDIQKTLMYQASKALNLCHSMKEFWSSPEQAESERLLLLADLRKKAALSEIKKICNEQNNNEIFCEKGMVTIENISLPLKEDILKEEKESGEFVQWFVIIISHGLTVWASHAITCPIKSLKINFPGFLSIPNLTPGFKINIQIYSLKLRRVTYNYEEKYHLNKNEKRTTCPSPQKLLKKSEKSISPKQCQISTITKSSFVLSGYVELYLHDLTLVSPWPLMSVPKDSVLHGTIDLSLTCKLYLSISHTGFLTHCDEAGGFAVWNRRWCVLEGHALMFWNYPRDQETKCPLLIIDLMHCISDRVTIVDRSLCAKPKTMLIETARRRNAMDRNSMVVECRSACTVVRNLLSCDTVQELTGWISKLNHVISALHEWNVITKELEPLITDL